MLSVPAALLSLTTAYAASITVIEFSLSTASTVSLGNVSEHIDYSIIDLQSPLAKCVWSPQYQEASLISTPMYNEYADFVDGTPG